MANGAEPQLIVPFGTLSQLKSHCEWERLWKTEESIHQYWGRTWCITLPGRRLHGLSEPGKIILHISLCGLHGLWWVFLDLCQLFCWGRSAENQGQVQAGMGTRTLIFFWMPILEDEMGNNSGSNYQYRSHFATTSLTASHTISWLTTFTQFNIFNKEHLFAFLFFSDTSLRMQATNLTCKENSAGTRISLIKSKDSVFD